MGRTPAGTEFDLVGPQGAPAVLLIHGLGLSRATWADHVPVLAARYRVISYDLCGHGETALPTREPSLKVLAEQVIELLDHLGIEQAALVGFSLGGMINRKVAMLWPDRVSALVILNSPHERDPEAQALVEKRARDTGAGGAEATIEETLRRWFTPAFLASSADTVQWVRETVLANDPKNYVAHRYVLAAGVTELIRPNPPLSHPTFVLTCENDSGSTPAMSEEIAGEIPGAKVEIIPNLQHLGLLEAPQEFASKTCAFLKRVLG